MPKPAMPSNNTLHDFIRIIQELRAETGREFPEFIAWLMTVDVYQDEELVGQAIIETSQRLVEEIKERFEVST